MSIRIKLITLIFLLLSFGTEAQITINKDNLYAPFAKTQMRAIQAKELKAYAQKLKNPLDLNSKELSHILKELSLYYYRDSIVERGLNLILNNYENFPVLTITKTITAAKALYPYNFKDIVTKILKATDDKYIFSYAVIYISEYPKQLNARMIDSLMNVKFPGFAEDDYLNELHYCLTNIFTPLSHSQIVSVLKGKYQKNATIIFSIHRHNRENHGLTIIRKPDGSFVRNDSGKIFSIPQLGLAVGNLPGFMRDGNTPQGIFSVVGTYVSPTQSIGPTPNVLTRIPFGKPPEVFFHNKNKYSDWNIKDYIALLPEEVRDKQEFYEAFYAGKFGRRLLVMHGSVDNLDYYKNEKYYPLSPTKGCLSAIELWDSTGSSIRSDQAKLINAFYSTNNLKGFLVVFEIDDGNSPITIEEITPYILEAEKE